MRRYAGSTGRTAQGTPKSYLLALKSMVVEGMICGRARMGYTRDQETETSGLWNMS